MAPPRNKGAVATSEVKKKTKIEDESLMYSAESMQHNVQAVYCCRTFLAIIGGCVTGIMGFTGILGFFCYFLTMGIASAGLLVKAKFNVGKYFDTWNRLALDGVMGGLMNLFFELLVLDEFSMGQLRKGLPGQVRLALILLEKRLRSSLYH